MSRWKTSIFVMSCCILFAFLSGNICAADNPQLPGDLKAGKLLYESSLSNQKSVKGWKMEGPGEVKFEDGWMEMFSPDEKMHHVFWCPERFPENFIAQWEAQNLETDAGLCIVFFAAAAKDGGSIFADDLPKRGGHFKRYTQGALRCYHTSYYANAAHNPDRGQTNLRKNPGFHLVQEGLEGIPTKSEKVHTITLAKQGGHIRLWVDDKQVIDWTDRGKKGGEPHGDGFIGFRQMKWTHFRYRDFRVWNVANKQARLPERENPIPAFPGAEGFGAYARGGRGGRIIRVTNLKDYDPETEEPIPGSFRAACSAEGPRTIVFDVAGWIDLKNQLDITEPYCTIAGQTAPGGGIGVRGETVRIGNYTVEEGERAHDVIVRYMRFRAGPGREHGHAPDSLAINNAHDVIVDHCSISWGVDECMSITAHPWHDGGEVKRPLALKNRPRGETYNVTVQWSIISEGLYNSTHRKGHHSRGLMCTYGSSRVSIHHNLMAHNHHRNPNLPWQLAGIDNPYIVDVVNNVVYNYGGRVALTKHNPQRNPGFQQKGNINYVGNLCIMGPDSQKVHSLEIRNPAAVWAKANIGPYRTSQDMDQYACVGGDFKKARERFDTPEVTTMSPGKAKKQVLARAGATRPERDAVDRRVVREVRQEKGGIIDDPEERGGWPDLKTAEKEKDTDNDAMPDAWEKKYELDPTDGDDGPADADGDGYTNREEYLNATNPRKVNEHSIFLSAWWGGKDKTEDTEQKDEADLASQVFSGIAVPRLKNITVDGEAADWGTNGFEIKTLHQRVATGWWEKDSEPTVRIGWDQKGLLVMTQVEDDRWIEAEKENMLWKLDGVELYLARRPGSPQYYQLVISPGMDEDHAELRYKLYDKRSDKPGTIRADVARTRNGRKCVIEARLPWKALNIRPGPGTECGIQVMVNDHDADGEKYDNTAHSVWYKELGTAQDSSRMHVLRLTNAAGESVQADSELGYAQSGGYVIRVQAAPKLAGQSVIVRRGGQKYVAAKLLLSEDGLATAQINLRGQLAHAEDTRLTVTINDIAVGRHDLDSMATDEMRMIIKRAGNAESEKLRYKLLSKLKKRGDLPPKLSRNLKRLVPVVDWWANGGKKARKGTGGRAAENGYLCRFFYPQAMLGRGEKYPPEVGEDSPLYPVWAYYRARCLLWIPIQIGGIRRDEKEREKYYSKARKYLEVAGEAFPDNRTIAMYNGEPYPWPAYFERDPNAPRWANLQREGLEKLTDVIHWWIDNRQIKDGQFGGGWGDDVEMWRWWTPVLVAFADPKIVEAQSKLSNSILSEPHLKKGYTSNLSDVEHTAEDTGDSIAPMIFLEPDEPEWRRRAVRIIELAEKVWMGKNERGFLQFKSTWFSVDEVDLTPRRACDTVYHPRVFHPALIHWLRSGDRTVGNLITRWMDTWVDATERAENGKPAGITPSAIHWPDGEVGGGVEPWWKPDNYRNDLYAWPSAMSLMTRTMLLTYHMTGNDKYLKPIRSMARIRRKYLKNPPENEPEPGSAAWCALEGSSRFSSRGMKRFLPATLAKYRVLTGDSQFDDLLRVDAGGYMKMLLGEGKEALIKQLEENAKAFRINKPAYTSEMRWTDRVLTFNGRWGNEGNGWDWPTPNTDVLYAAATGDPGDPRYFPMNAVRWLIEPRAFAALVKESGAHQFTAKLYNFRQKKRDVPAMLYLLKKGKYELSLTDQKGKTVRSEQIKVTGPRTRIEIDLPPRNLCILEVTAKD